MKHKQSDGEAHRGSGDGVVLKNAQDTMVDHSSNEQVLQRADAMREIMTSIRQMQLRFLGHTMKEQQLENLYLTRKVEGKRGRGRPRIKFVDGLAISCGGGMSATEMLRLTVLRQE